MKRHPKFRNVKLDCIFLHNFVCVRVKQKTKGIFLPKLYISIHDESSDESVVSESESISDEDDISIRRFPFFEEGSRREYFFLFF